MAKLDYSPWIVYSPQILYSQSKLMKIVYHLVIGTENRNKRLNILLAPETCYLLTFTSAVILRAGLDPLGGRIWPPGRRFVS